MKKQLLHNRWRSTNINWNCAVAVLQRGATH